MSLALANIENDLQAWYHSTFYQEVYRLHGPFWYRDAVLPKYRQSYSIIDTGMTQLEEAAVSHVLCSPDTTYGDVAGQMFVLQAITIPSEYKLFQLLAADGCDIIKYPRYGRPAKKHFRLSFVEGNIYFTWKGKFGNQGVNLAEVNGVSEGISTDLLKKSAKAVNEPHFVSLRCADRSVDLYLDKVEEQEAWKNLLTKLVAKEHGELLGVEIERPVLPNHSNSNHRGLNEVDLEWFILYTSIGEKVLSPVVRAHLLKLDLTA